MKVEHIDIHSHLNFPEFEDDREAVIADMAEKGIATITVGTNLETSHQAVLLATAHDHLFAAIGIHPVDDPKATFDTKEFELLIQHPKVVAIGECGLDYGKSGQIDESEKARQKALFETHIDFAAKHNKPLMIHCRNAYEDVLDILESKKRELGAAVRAHMHFFAGDLAIARRCIDNDFTLSFTGVITFAPSYRELVSFAPLSHIMAETDSPFVAPEPFRGRRNDPRHVVEVVKAIASIRGDDLEEVKKALCDNAKRVFSLPML